MMKTRTLAAIAIVLLIVFAGYALLYAVRSQVPAAVASPTASAPPPGDQRAALTKVRRAIRTAAPDAVEYIGYGLAGFKRDGKPLIYFGAAKTHCALYGPAIVPFASELEGFETSKGTVRFTPRRPIPASLVTKIVKARAAELRHRAGR